MPYFDYLQNILLKGKRLDALWYDMEALFELLRPIGNDAALFIVSLIPFIELRGGIVLGITVLGMDWLRTFLICFIANCIPIPFVILLTRPIFNWLKKTRLLSGFVNKLEAKLHKKSGQITEYKYWFIGLMLFVAIPLPGTGAYTGSLIAALLDMRMKKAFPAIVLGVFVAAVIMTLAATVLSSAIGFIL